MMIKDLLPNHYFVLVSKKVTEVSLHLFELILLVVVVVAVVVIVAVAVVVVVVVIVIVIVIVVVAVVVGSKRVVGERWL